VRRFRFLDYLVVCGFFIAFCLLQQFIAVKMLGGSAFAAGTFEWDSLSFFFGTMWKGFLVVALLVWLIDFFSGDIEEDDSA
jgi:hypothetical protein